MCVCGTLLMLRNARERCIFLSWIYFYVLFLLLSKFVLALNYQYYLSKLLPCRIRTWRGRRCCCVSWYRSFIDKHELSTETLSILLKFLPDIMILLLFLLSDIFIFLLRLKLSKSTRFVFMRFCQTILDWIMKTTICLFAKIVIHLLIAFFLQNNRVNLINDTKAVKDDNCVITHIELIMIFIMYVEYMPGNFAYLSK